MGIELQLLHGQLVHELEGQCMDVMIKGQGNTRVNFAVPHLLAAAKFSRALGELERQHAGEPLGNFWEDMQSYATGCILTAAAALESYANECFDDCYARFPEKDPAKIAALWTEYERLQPMDKFKCLLKQLGVRADLAGKSPGQDVASAIKIRNGLIHFKPRWSYDLGEEHKNISRDIKSYVIRSRFFPEPEPVFPRAWASHGTAKWTVKKTVAFISEFALLAGLPNPVDMFADRLRPD